MFCFWLKTYKDKKIIKAIKILFFERAHDCKQHWEFF